MIRPLRADDIEAVTSLYQRVVRGPGPAPSWLAPYFRDTLVDHPWYDDEIPSLVYEEADGTISASIGVHVRRIHFDGTPRRLACSGQLVADPTRGARGLLVLRAFLAGAQDISITDGANAPSRIMWQRLGGVTRELQSVSWATLLRPGRLAIHLVRSRSGRHRVESAAATLGSGFDAVWARVPHRSPRRTVYATEPLDAEGFVSLLPTLTKGMRVAPAYDVEFARWLFGLLERSTARGVLRARAVLGSAGAPVGVYVYYLARGGRSDVLTLLAKPGSLASVLEALGEDARRGGAAAVLGRLEPGIVDALADRRHALRYSGAALIHTRDPDLLRAVQAGEAALTLLEGEYWMAHHLRQ